MESAVREWTVGALRMRLFACLLITSAFLVPKASGATDAVVMPAKGDTCKETRLDPDHAREETEWQCAGPGGFSLKYRDTVMQAGVTIGYRGKEFGSESLAWGPAKSGIGSRIEWRIEDGKPIAAIVGRWRRAEDPKGSDEVEVEELLIVKITSTGACAIGAIGGLSPTAMISARSFVEARAATFRCGIDKPFINTDLASDATKAIDGHFSSVEILEHNGSS